MRCGCFPRKLPGPDTSWSSKPEDLERISEHDRLYWDRNAVEPGRDTACGLCAQQVGFGRSSTVLGIYPVYDVLYRRACANVSRSPEFGADQHDGALILPVAKIGMEHHRCPDVLPDDDSQELQEAAYMDGCTNLKLFVRIILPLSAPIIAVMALFYGVSHWNSYFPALIYLNDESKYPLQMVPRQILVLQEMTAETTGAAISGDAARAMSSKAETASLIKYGVIVVSTSPIVALYPFTTILCPRGYDWFCKRMMKAFYII